LIEDEAMAEAKFGIGDHVRFIGTDTVQTVRQFNEDTSEFLVQNGDDPASAVWVRGKYLEQVEPAKRFAVATGPIPR
jgi:hypothetical protein